MVLNAGTLPLNILDARIKIGLRNKRQLKNKIRNLGQVLVGPDLKPIENRI